MERKSIIIDIPDGMCIDESKSTFEKIVFKKKDTKPRSWEEYRAKVPENKLYKVWGVVEGEELAEAFIAMMKLMSLRQAWIGDWKPDWKDTTSKWSIAYEKCKLGVYYHYYISHSLTFPTKEMATDFMNCFKDLLNVARPLI